ncbi:hypothetical protein F511_30964 [Dorcoceras hygrometricum]|uniref:Uncharacterized protein n=1 Tax=Dorcoceras hygrometricum TaxID=472368 RepID=A0A2Z7D630_9LAMI|nr:hypothetical protein F511_30964 [Dorcoceras hygrometricum]
MASNKRSMGTRDAPPAVLPGHLDIEVIAGKTFSSPPRTELPTCFSYSSSYTVSWLRSGDTSLLMTYRGRFLLFQLQQISLSLFLEYRTHDVTPRDRAWT